MKKVFFFLTKEGLLLKLVIKLSYNAFVINATIGGLYQKGRFIVIKM